MSDAYFIFPFCPRFEIDVIDRNSIPVNESRIFSKDARPMHVSPSPFSCSSLFTQCLSYLILSYLSTVQGVNSHK